MNAAPEWIPIAAYRSGYSAPSTEVSNAPEDMPIAYTRAGSIVLALITVRVMPAIAAESPLARPSSCGAQNAFQQWKAARSAASPSGEDDEVVLLGQRVVLDSQRLHIGRGVA